IARLQVGDIAGAEAELAAEARLADELRQPAQLWQARSAQALLALAAGRLVHAEELIAHAVTYRQRPQPGFALPAFRLQRYMLCDFRGCVEEVEASIRDLVVEYPARIAFRCVLARLESELGGTGQARRGLQDLAKNDCAALPFDLEWLYGMSHLAETAAIVGDTDSAAVLYRLLIPWETFNAVDVPEGMRGSVSRYVRLLAATMDQFDDAERHFEQALESNGRMGARPWLALAEEDYARMLRARGRPGDAERGGELLERALETYRELGMQGPLARA